ncbi:hypothetical protein [Levilactobacillus koreensis]|nr:hypothetical protein [Levilactobacillus koreensis]
MLYFDFAMGREFDEWFNHMKKVVLSGKLTSIERDLLEQLLEVLVSPNKKINLLDELGISIDDLDLAFARLEYYGLVKYWVEDETEKKVDV